MTKTLLPCPFCGGRANFEREGTGGQSCIVSCDSCGARHESSDEYEQSGSSWNERTAAKADERGSAEPDSDATCNVSPVSSRICERGVKGCNTEHTAPARAVAEPQGLTDAEILEATFEVSHADITALSEYNIAICRALEAYLAARASAGKAA